MFTALANVDLNPKTLKAIATVGSRPVASTAHRNRRLAPVPRRPNGVGSHGSFICVGSELLVLFVCSFANRSAGGGLYCGADAVGPGVLRPHAPPGRALHDQ
eukprot:442413-Pyramimonas_sp.AAC.1